MKTYLKKILKNIDKIDFNSPEFIARFEKADRESDEIVASAKRHTVEELNYRFG